ncbi:hypothetical protein [Archangium sp.]|jgi:hypothetical protein|uniref:hypothetical protein n=1 Tax=Archangium sp. TaxID=1872627 RepID=UPI00389ABF4C
MAVIGQAIGTDMTLEEIGDTINSLIQQGNTNQHQIGTLYNHVVDRKLAEVAGYKNAQVYFSRKVKAVSQSTLTVYGTVARNFPEAICTNFGVYTLRALLRYVEATGMVLDRGNPGVMVIDVPQDDGKVVAKPFAECSVDELERATRLKKTPPPVRVPVPDKARLLFFEDSLLRNFDGVAPVRLSSRSEDGKTLLSVQDVPMSEVARLLKALQEGMNAEPTLAAK